jgi:hypothetical protein
MTTLNNVCTIPNHFDQIQNFEQVHGLIAHTKVIIGIHLALKNQISCNTIPSIQVQMRSGNILENAS